MADIVTQIRNLQRRIQDLRDKLNAAKRRLSDALSLKSGLERRLSQLQAIRNDAASGLTGRTDDVSTDQGYLVNKIGSSVKKHAHADELGGTVRGDKEQVFSSDSYGYEAIRAIDCEIRSVQDQIREKNNTINREQQTCNQTQNQINSTNASIQNLQRQAANG